MLSTFDGLLVTAPNLGGGTFLIDAGVAMRLDDRTATGLAMAPDHVALGLQPDRFEIYARGRPPRTVSCGDVHDLLFHEGSLYAVATQENRVMQFSIEGELLADWRFDGAQDSMHINCLAVWGGSVVFSAFGDFTEHRGFKGRSFGRGFVQDLRSGQRRITGLSQPHSLLCVGGNLLLANSETFELQEYDPAGNSLRSKRLHGYCRGLCFSGGQLFVGLSNSRNAASLLESAELIALDPVTWRQCGRLSLPTDEIYTIASIEQCSLASRMITQTALRYAARIAALATAVKGDAAHLVDRIQQLRWWRPRQLSETRVGLARIQQRLSEIEGP
jgi:hypothetical protein